MAKQENRNTLSTSVLVRRFLPYFRKYRKTMAFDLCCPALTTVCELVLPLILRYITNLGMNDLSALTVQFAFHIPAKCGTVIFKILYVHVEKYSFQ